MLLDAIEPSSFKKAIQVSTVKPLKLDTSSTPAFALRAAEPMEYRVRL
jgi:hypothetical protein